MRKVKNTEKGKTTTANRTKGTVRKAAELKSINDLNLPQRTVSYLENRYSSLEEIIFKGREMAYDDYYYGAEPNRELVQALNEAGFIRHDLISEYFKINALYSNLTLKETRHFAPRCVTDFSFIKNNKNPDYKIGNQKYENAVMLSAYQIGIVKEFLKRTLSRTQYAIIVHRYGLENSHMPLYSLARYFDITRGHMHQIEYKALKKLRNPAILREFPPIFDNPEII